MFTLVACDNPQRQDKPEQETPKALEDKSVSSEILSKRGYDDLVESLYSELLDKNQDLKNLENKIQELNQSKNDSTKSFDNFNTKSINYYSAANRRIDQLNDSLLRIKMRTLISSSLTKYKSSITTHETLLKTIDAGGITISDLHTTLKITETLPLIEKYQHNNLPSTKPLEGFIQKQNQAIKLADTLSKK